ncbi:TOR complex subunit lst8, variant 3 [Entomophthora muscae]|uniref:TOR complex subunit lst8, variant 3 n=1 Tax=Entomophthora muscae TaxID=34485 RepID=A0ACC2TI13_9FUNG|nr:TOR complex subunit lst8, variant 3 [Entomophthora muscae]
MFIGFSVFKNFVNRVRLGSDVKEFKGCDAESETLPEWNLNKGEYSIFKNWNSVQTRFNPSPYLNKKEVNFYPILDSKPYFLAQKQQFPCLYYNLFLKAYCKMELSLPAGYRDTEQPRLTRSPIPAPSEAHSVILATAGYDLTIRFWDALSGSCIRTIVYPNQNPKPQINKLCISPDRRYLVAGDYRNIRLFEINSLNSHPLCTLEGHTNNITSIAFHPEGKWLASGSEDGTVKIWDTRAPSVQRNFKHGSPVNDFVIHPDSLQLLSCSRDGSIKLWNVGSTSCVHELVPDDDISMQSITISSDGSTVVAGSTKGSCYVWSMGKGSSGDFTAVTKFTAHNNYLTKCLLSPDSKVLATCSADSTVKIWNANNQFKHEKTLTGSSRWVWDCSFSADSSYLVTGTMA